MMVKKLFFIFTRTLSYIPNSFKSIISFGFYVANLIASSITGYFKFKSIYEIKNLSLFIFILGLAFTSSNQGIFFLSKIISMPTI